jgi:hypothetical protein
MHLRISKRTHGNLLIILAMAIGFGRIGKRKSSTECLWDVVPLVGTTPKNGSCMEQEGKNEARASPVGCSSRRGTLQVLVRLRTPGGMFRVDRSWSKREACRWKLKRK